MRFYSLLAGTLLMAGLSACVNDHGLIGANRVKGPTVTLGNGQAYAWADLDAQRNPTGVGIALTKGALDNLPPAMPGTSFLLTLPAEIAGKTAFNHISLDYNPMGHEPTGIYTLPHFDMHFYATTPAFQAAIPPYMPATAAKFDNLPPAGFMPASYIRLPGGVPGMGTHWADPTSPELAGATFTETFIFGSYDGALTFYEPMITINYLKGSPNMTKNIAQPTKFAMSVYYPTRYRISPEGTDMVVALEGMVKK